MREICSSLADDSAHHAAVSDLYRTIVARLVARQVCGRWRYLWPWLAWIATAVVAGQTGYNLARYVASKESIRSSEFLYEVFGFTSLGELFFTIPAILIFGEVFRTYESSLVARAQVAAQFYRDGIISPPGSHVIARAPASRSRVRVLANFLKNQVPGLFSLSAGFLIGVTIFRRLNEVDDQSEAFKAVVGWGIISFSGLGTCMLLVAAVVTEKIRESGFLTHTHPPLKALSRQPWRGSP